MRLSEVAVFAVEGLGARFVSDCDCGCGGGGEFLRVGEEGRDFFDCGGELPRASAPNGVVSLQHATSDCPSLSSSLLSASVTVYVCVCVCVCMCVCV